MYNNAHVKKSIQVLEIKGGLVPITILHPISGDLNRIAYELSHKIDRAPAFFHNVPVIIDLKELSETVNVLDLVKVVRSKGMIPIGAKGGDKIQQKSALAAGLGLFPKGKTLASGQCRKEAIPERPRKTPDTTNRTKIISHPVRSGQQVYSPGDIIVLSAVSAGAEIMAEGCIHVYGALRGRALAGGENDKTARIFCQSLEAELVSIAGNYKVFEDSSALIKDKPVQIYLENNLFKIRPL